jgi:hypothetical protein
MFWKRSKRVSRRQRVLEELLWLDPVDRERRAIAAVAAGDFGADEVDAVLRLVARLDSLRDMSPPRGGRLLASSPAVGYRAADAADAPEPPDGQSRGAIGPEFEPDLVVGSRRDAEAAAVAQATAPAEARSRAEGGGDAGAGAGGEASTGNGHREPRHRARGGHPARDAGAIPIERERVAVPVEAELLAVPVDSDPAGPPVDALDAAERWISGERSKGGRAPARSQERGVREATTELQAASRSETSRAESSEGDASGTADEAWPTIAWLRPG